MMQKPTWLTVAVSLGASLFLLAVSVGAEMRDLGTLAGNYSAARAINASGQIVGATTTGGLFATHAFLYSGGKMQDLGTLGGLTSTARGINDSGQVVGSSTIKGGNTHAFSYYSGKMTDLGTLGGNYSIAYGINNTGQIVGVSTTSTGGTHAFLYSAGVMKDQREGIITALPTISITRARSSGIQPPLTVIPMPCCTTVVR
jgi:probable HAF family extracellular repeat protein